MIVYTVTDIFVHSKDVWVRICTNRENVYSGTNHKTADTWAAGRTVAYTHTHKVTHAFTRTSLRNHLGSHKSVYYVSPKGT